MTSEWTCIPVEPTGPYGTKTFQVPARQNWVNTGLYLKAGETATITETGTWTVTGAGSTIDHGSCRVGDLVARVGLHYKDPELTCVDGETTFVADKDGILFVGALPSNDLGETYESRSDDDGEKTVTISSNGATVPTISADQAAAYDLTAVTGGFVEIWGQHVILTLPLATAILDQSTLAAAAARLDDIYDLAYELRGALPHSGQRIRFFPDETTVGYMLAGNPVRMKLDLVQGGDTTRISRAGEPGTSVWGFAHELGHDFSFAPHGFWTYQPNSLEAWPNIFSVYVFEKLGLELNNDAKSCTSSSTGSFEGGSWSPWTGLCFLRQFQFRYGWQFYKDFFASILDTTSTGGDGWHFVHDRFEQIAGEDITPIFTAWGVPHP